MREQWPLLLRSLPFKAAFSMACRMPGQLGLGIQGSVVGWICCGNGRWRLDGTFVSDKVSVSVTHPRSCTSLVKKTL